MLKHIRNLVFDLDDTLYPKSSGYTELSNKKIKEFISDKMGGLSIDEYRKLSREYHQEHGSSYKLFKDKGTSFEDYISYVSEHDMSNLNKDDELRKNLLSLTHNMFIYTDSTIKHVRDTFKVLEIDNIFSDIFTIKESNYIWKSYDGAFDKFIEYYQLNPMETAIFEDSLKNLENAKKVGMTTILISEELIEKPDYCDFVFDNINSAIKLFL